MRCGNTFSEEIIKCVRKISIACAVAFSLPPHYFANFFEKGTDILFRLLHYPPVDEEVAKLAEDGDRIRIAEHTDYGLITMLFTDGPGLQVKAAENDLCLDTSDVDWVDIPPQEGTTAIINLGGLMTRITNNEWKSVAHRVIVPKGPQALLPRYSIAGFVSPDKDVVVKVSPTIANGKEVLFEETTTAEYFKRRVELNGKLP